MHFVLRGIIGRDRDMLLVCGIHRVRRQFLQLRAAARQLMRFIPIDLNDMRVVRKIKF